MGWVDLLLCCSQGIERLVGCGQRIECLVGCGRRILRSKDRMPIAIALRSATPYTADQVSANARCFNAFAVFDSDDAFAL